MKRISAAVMGNLALPSAMRGGDDGDASVGLEAVQRGLGAA